MRRTGNFLDHPDDCPLEQVPVELPRGRAVLTKRFLVRLENPEMEMARMPAGEIVVAVVVMVGDGPGMRRKRMRGPVRDV